MKKILIFALILGATGLFAQNKQEEKSNLKFSFMERIRVETWDNTGDLSNLGTGTVDNFRFKTSVGMIWNISSDVEFGSKITNEFRKHVAPKTNPFRMSEVFIDNLYLKVDNFLSGTLTLGRQEISMGEGFLIKDGNGGDGSRSTYFNAVRFDWKMDKTNTLTLFGVYQPIEDKLLPVLNGKDVDASSQAANGFRLVEQTEYGASAYYSGDFGKTNLQGYFIWKKMDFDEKKIIPESNINTAGGRIKTPFSDAVTLTAEAGYQFGTIGDFNRAAYGGYAYVDIKTGSDKVFLPKTVTIGTLALSGDDPSTPDYEGWDPVFGRWPKWSESFVYNNPKEFGRTSNWSNIFDLFIKFEFAVMKEIDITLQNHFLMAMQQQLKTAFLSGEGTNRGNLTTFKINYKINANTTGHFIWEHLEPGNHYFSGADPYNWFRFELLFNF